MRRKINSAVYVFLASFLLAGSAGASTLLIGPAGQGGVQLYDSNGTFQGSYGPDGATAGVLNAMGQNFVAVPNLDDNLTTIYEYGADTTSPLGQFTFQGMTPAANDGYIDDMASDSDGTLWLAGFDGQIYQVNASTGMVLSSFSTGNSFTGIASNGSQLYTTTGLGSGTIDIYGFNGTLTGTLTTSLADSLGIGYDSSAGTLWVGGIGTVTQIDMSGMLVSSVPLASGVTATGVEVASTPDAPTAALAGLGLLILGLFKFRGRGIPTPSGTQLRAICGALVVLIFAHGAYSMPNISSLTPSVQSPQPIGTSVTWTAAATDGANTLWYRFSVSAPGGSFSIVRDYRSDPTFTWVPSQTDGIYQIQVTVKNQTDQSTNTLSLPFTVNSLVSTQPVVVSTPHPLVALYAAPACPAGSSMRVRFWRRGDTTYRATPAKACNGTSSMNFYIAGMRGSSAYLLQHDTIRGPQIVSGPQLSFTTGMAGVGVTATVTVPAGVQSSQSQQVLLFSGLGAYPNAAIDMSGNLLWYYNGGGFLARPEAGGNMYILTQPAKNTNLTQTQNSELQVMKEIDLAGNTILEINAARVGELLGYPVNMIHHECRRLPNGNLIFLVATERFADQGAGLVDVVGDVIVVLDQNLNLVWSWNTFDHLDTSRPSTTHDVCNAGGSGGCPPIYNALTANDWTHGNAASVTADGKYVVFSSRHQDWVMKIDYNNGTGSGAIIWKLGYQGDFSISTGNPADWFSHQHDAEFELNGQQVLSVFDNGNFRQQPASTNHSRGQVYSIDETSHVATLVLSGDMGVYSSALGAAQRLANGNYAFDAGAVIPTHLTEFAPDGSTASAILIYQQSYRAFRMQDLYVP